MGMLSSRLREYVKHRRSGIRPAKAAELAGYAKPYRVQGWRLDRLKAVQIELAKPLAGSDSLVEKLSTGMSRAAACDLLATMGQNDDINPNARIAAVRLLAELNNWATAEKTQQTTNIFLGKTEENL
jgi:hypothetical protein